MAYKNYFQALKIYFHDLIIYFQTFTTKTRRISAIA